VEVAEYLLERGADIDARDIDHESTPAQWMIRDRQIVARYLVERGCRTDILMAAALGDEARVKALLDADPSAIRTSVSEAYFPKQDSRSGGTVYNWTLGTGKTAHAIAHEFGHPSVLRILLEQSPDPLRLTVACQIGDEEAVRRLLARDPGLLRSLSGDDLRKLPDAARDQNTAAVRLMLSAGWPVDARGQHGATALHWAGWHGDTTMAREVLQYGPPLEITDHDYGGTPLFWTVYGSVHGWRCRTGDYAGTVEVLLDAGSSAPRVTEELEASDAVREVLVRRTT
jgi:ankyrin repeat protein